MKALLILLIFQSYSQSLFIIRHGEGEHNVHNLYNSSPDNPNYTPVHLTPKGISQALTTAKKLQSLGLGPDNITKIFHSPLPRTFETATHIAQVIKVQSLLEVKKDLIEVNSGAREGLCHDLFSENGWDNSIFDGPYDCEKKMGGGEDDLAVERRVLPLLKSLGENPPEKNIIFVTHGTPAKIMIELLTGFPVKLDTAEVMEVPLHEISKRLKNNQQLKEHAQKHPAVFHYIEKVGCKKKDLYTLKEALSFMNFQTH